VVQLSIYKRGDVQLNLNVPPLRVLHRFLPVFLLFSWFFTCLHRIYWSCSVYYRANTVPAVEKLRNFILCNDLIAQLQNAEDQRRYAKCIAFVTRSGYFFTLQIFPAHCRMHEYANFIRSGSRRIASYSEGSFWCSACCLRLSVDWEMPRSLAATD